MALPPITCHTAAVDPRALLFTLCLVEVRRVHLNPKPRYAQGSCCNIRHAALGRLQLGRL